MCGIVGVVNFDKTIEVNKEGLKKAVNSIAHRGPDANGVAIINKNIGFGFVRLSIIDLSEESNQPFEYQNLTIIFNGEIFNYLELKKELVGKGYDFRTESDTEVILASYLEWGQNCVNKFNGMWAFAIFDSKNNQLFCSRDRFGIKPFNYYKNEDTFIFSSEIKGILAYNTKIKKVNYNSISRYCRETVGAQAEETWFENILRLKPAHNIVITKNSFKIVKYWDYPSQETNNNNNNNTSRTEKKYFNLLKDSVRLRFRSDVPVGLTLSGGLDSSAIAYLARDIQAGKLNAYTASFPNHPFNEYHIAKDICEELNINSVEVLPEYTRYVGSLKKLIFHLESGHGSPAIFPLDAIAKRAKKNITVYLEGQGADELLGGYYDGIIPSFILSEMAKFKFVSAFSVLKELYTRRKLKPAFMIYLRQIMPHYFRYFYRKILGLERIYDGELKTHKPYTFKLNTKGKNWSQLTKMLVRQHQNGLVNLLHYGDAISMKHSLENRLPFMDYRIVEYIFRLSDDHKVNKFFGKVIHRNVFEKILPTGILNEKNKLGFVSPLKQIFLEDKFGANDMLLSHTLENRKIFKKHEIERLITEHKSGKRNHERILFKILNVELWFQNFIDL